MRLTRSESNLCPVCNEVVERDHLVRGYDLAKGQYIQITDELKELIPITKGDPVYFEGAHYLAPDQGGDKADRLLAECTRARTAI